MESRQGKIRRRELLSKRLEKSICFGSKTRAKLFVILLIFTQNYNWLLKKMDINSKIM
jgi:hypothetical protein